MQIDVISDTVCPWCFIGKRRLARAMAMRPAITFDVKWRPYRLDPTIPNGGTDRKAYMRAKFGTDPMKIVEMHKLIAAEGAKDGIEFDFAAIERRPDTLDSHRLIRWAEATGVQDEVVERLFIAYFENGEDIGDIRVLADIADIGDLVLGVEVFVRLGRLQHRDQVLAGAALAPRGKAHAVTDLEQPRHVLGTFDIAGKPEEVLCGAPQHLVLQHPGILGAAALAGVDDQ